jgi:hypothetical protein
MATKIFRCTLAVLLVLSRMAAQEKGGTSDPTPSNHKISEAANKLLRKPRLGSAELTWADGRKQKGHILRVTDQFIAFQTDFRRSACTNVELSEIADVKFFHAPGEPGAGSDVANVVEGVFLVAFLAPFMVADAVAELFRQTPLKPLRGTWEASGPSHGHLSSRLEFTGNKVVYRTTIRKLGRWSVERGEVHLAVDGEPEWITSFHFECEELVLDNPAERFWERRNRSHPAAPIVGDWHGRQTRLTIEPDGSLVEEKDMVREGTFQNSSTSVSMHWADSTGPGGAEWAAQIAHRHIVVSIGGATTEYHYLKPSFVELDL